jgi:hypothetical protein
MKTRARALATICSMTCLAGCGGGGGHVGISPVASTSGATVDQIRAVLVKYAHDVAAGDGAATCALLDANAQLQLAQIAAGGQLGSSTPSAPGCAQSIEQESAELTAPDRAALATITVGAVVVDGTTATVDENQVSSPGDPPTGSSGGNFVLVEIGGEWQLDSVTS